MDGLSWLAQALIWGAVGLTIAFGAWVILTGSDRIEGAWLVKWIVRGFWFLGISLIGLAVFYFIVFVVIALYDLYDSALQSKLLGN